VVASGGIFFRDNGGVEKVMLLPGIAPMCRAMSGDVVLESENSNRLGEIYAATVIHFNRGMCSYWAAYNSVIPWLCY
jgi:hypothetical protein